MLKTTIELYGENHQNKSMAPSTRAASSGPTLSDGLVSQGMKKLPMRCLAVLSLTAGGILIYSAGWLVLSAILPQIQATGWSLHGDNLILNRNWQNNQLYLLVGLYAAIGGSLLLAGMAAWRRAGVA